MPKPHIPTFVSVLIVVVILLALYHLAARHK
jgi:Tfp pilus assembly protein PilV